ncbi:conserved hypothetical protein [Paraburkholderia unamae]|uniref:hypothetical protein n=1 Tax=Paraburkholderia unamae TaxID=219649 RepID=UPI001CB08A84|nr:hypothetical protein [Paraburkholderia unamae]CAG9255027.1 conserved hypothetical protein [Paraburkholderia unamae]
MSNHTELDLPVALAAAPFETVGMTVRQVVSQIERRLRQSELDPEWIDVANVADDAHEARFGLRGDAAWPHTSARHARLCLSVATGHSEGWHVQIDFVLFVEDGERGGWRSQPLVRIKVLTRSHAWSVAAVVSRLLDID